MPSNHFILYCPLLLLPSTFISIRVFSNESALCIRWPKYWSFSFSISPSNEYSGLISFRMDWLALLQSKELSRVFSNPHPWDSPGKNTGVGCHFLLQCMKVKSESEVAQSCPTDSSRPHGLQPTRLLCPWDFPGKSTGLGCHCLLQTEEANNY